VTGAARYVLGEGKGAGNDNLAPGERSRVDWIGGTGFGFEIRDRGDADLARRIMEFDALNQASRTRRCEKDVVHLILSWRPGETPDRAQMEEAARSALAAMGMANAKALFASHNDERHPHIHIVASKINPDTGRAYDLKGNYAKLSDWALAWERDHGGVLCLGREGNNGLREAIAARDAGAVLEQLTAQRPTFTAPDLERALARQIGSAPARAAFAAEVLGHDKVARLEDDAIARYSTRQVLAAEAHVLRAARALAGRHRHGIIENVRAEVLDRFPTMRADQRAAFERAIGAEGLALIDGQAGTGKSYTMTAVREAYEAAGYHCIGLAPTNAVAQDLGRDGFRHFGTAHSELFALNNERRAWNARTVVMVDEAAMLDTRMMAMLAAHAYQAGAKLILVGDDRQLASIERGGMFGTLKDRYGAAALTEVTRQYKQEDRRAASMLAEGNFADALGIYDAKGAIQWRRTQDQAQAALVAQWAKDSAADPAKSRFVFAYTNADVAALNADIRAVRKERGELGPDHRVPAQDGKLAVAAGDRLQITGNDKKLGLVNGAVGTVLGIEGTALTLQLDGRKGPTVTFDTATFPDFRHGYAGTIYKGQGRTLDQTYLYHSEHWRAAASYVALTRHREKAEIFVATNTARDAKELARQMARVDDRRAASQFQVQDGQERLRPLTPRELLVELGSPGPTTPAHVATPNAGKAEAGAAILPSVEARARQAGKGSMSETPTAEEAERRALEAAERNQRQQAQQDAQKRREEAQQQAEAQRLEALAREHADHQVRQAEAMREQRDRLMLFEAEQKRRAEEAQQEQENKRQAEARGQQAEGEIHDAGDRYRMALGRNYDIKDPYGSLARAAMDEYGTFIKQRAELKQQFAQEQDPEARKALELRMGIESADYMAITSRRIASQSEVITGRHDSEEAVRFREHADDYEAQSRELRQKYRELAAARAYRQPDQGQSSVERGPDLAPSHASRADRAAERDDGAEKDQAQPQQGASGDPVAERIRQRFERAQQADQRRTPEPELER
jgi:hypothetical protein